MISGSAFSLVNSFFKNAITISLLSNDSKIVKAFDIKSESIQYTGYTRFLVRPTLAEPKGGARKGQEEVVAVYP